jgi:hypothetical protein
MIMRHPLLCLQMTDAGQIATVVVKKKAKLAKATPRIQ